MSYQVLARKWRPKSFAELMGQDHVVRAISNALTTNRLHHAYLFTGTRGVGKTTIARILAKSLNCEIGVSATPCGQCTACTQIDAGRFVDLLEIDAASNTGIDNIREVLENAQYAPNAGRFKVYIIDEVHMLSKSAFNAMLKTLEEPPSHVKFILATTDPQKVPITVLSRCLQFNLKQMPPILVAEHLTQVLQKEQIPFEPEALGVIGHAAQGSMRDALSLLDQAIAYGMGKVEAAAVRDMLGTVDQGYLLDILEGLAQHDGATIVRIASQMAARALNFEDALSALALILQHIALYQTVPVALDAMTIGYDRIVRLANQLPAQDVQLYYQIALTGRKDLPLAPDEFAGFTMTLLRLLAFAPVTTPPPIVPPTGGGNAPAPRLSTQATSAPPAASVEAAQSAPAPIPPAAVAAPLPPPWVALPASEAHIPAPEVSAPAPVLAPEIPPPAQAAASPKSTPTTLADATEENWPDIVNALALTGAALMLAKHCVFKAFTQDVLRLRLQGHDNVLQVTEEKFSEALTRFEGRAVRLDIELGQVEGPTPIVLDNQARAEALSNAEESLLQHAVGQHLTQYAGARLIAGSVTVNASTAL